MTATNSTWIQNRVDPWKTWPVTVHRFRRHGSGVFTVDLVLNDPDVRSTFEYSPGQFNMLYVPGVGEAAISIAGTTATGVIQHTIRSVGAVTKAIEEGGVCMSLGLRGPFGKGWPLNTKLNCFSSAQSPSKGELARNGDVIVVAGGIGLAPLRAMIKSIATHRDDYGTVHIVIGARTPEDLLYQDEYDEWRSKKISVNCTVDRAPLHWRGQIGVVTLLLERLEIPHPALTTLLTCGPEVMMRYAAKSAMGRGIPEQRIFVALERNMNCAVGLCGHCQLGPAFICKDGPVFSYDSVSNLLRVQEF